MKIDILTLFPEMFDALTKHSIIGRAIDNGLIDFQAHNIRDYAQSKHGQADDYPYGGGAGMVMLAQPVLDCMADVSKGVRPKRIYLSPRGRVLDSALARELADEEHLLLLCGHYEGIDERILSQLDMQISVGDYVLTGGELPAMVLVDCISRFVPGVLGSEDSAYDESFSDGLLEYPQYTRPADFRGMKVPEILLSGHHANIEKWRREQALLLTAECRPDLLKQAVLTKADREFLARQKEPVLQDE